MYLGECFATHEEGYLEFTSQNVSKILTEFQFDTFNKFLDIVLSQSHKSILMYLSQSKKKF